MERPSLSISSATFSDGTVVTLRPDDIVIIVGANNSGKSEALRNIRQKVANKAATGVVVRDVSVKTEGDLDLLMNWIRKTARKMPSSPGKPVYSRGSVSVHEHLIKTTWNNPAGLRELSGFFCYHLSADERLQAANPPNNIALTRDPLSHPIHHLQANDVLEASISHTFRCAFEMDLIVHRNAGNNVPLHCGQRPTPPAGEDRVSLSYIRALESLPTLHTQGDGMRAFVGILLHTLVVQHSVVLIDEPEAFLHPPQIRQLARVIASGISPDSQIFVATHSGDFLRGILDANSERVRILRLHREGDINHVKELNNDRVKTLWSDSLLRYSNVLDGLFHEKAIVSESDSDCRFYSAIRDVVRDDGDAPNRDVMFTHCGGKARLPVVIRALRHLGVPIGVVADLDVLNDEQPFRAIYEELGGTWDDIAGLWNSVRAAIDEKKPELGTEEVVKEIEAILSRVKAPVFPKQSARELEKVLRRSSPWSILKEAGTTYIPAGTARQAYEQLSTRLRAQGLFLVEVGELEGFDKTVGGHGPRWVNSVLEKDLRHEGFRLAREFVSALVAH